MDEENSIRTEGNVSYYAAASTVVYVDTPMARKKVCRIEFSKRDGSIMIPFPYLNSKRGVLSDVTNQPPPGGPYTYDLSRNGVVVGYDVKFNHHRSGIAHFSKDGPNDVLPRRRVFPLDGTGVVFELHVHFLSGLDWVSLPRKRDLQLGFSFKDQHPIGIRVRGIWEKKDSIGSRAWPSGVVVGPRSDAEIGKTGELSRFAFLGQPDGFPLPDHVLLLSVSPVPAATGPDIPTMVFIGAVTPDTGPRDESSPPGFLSFLYPYSGTAARVPDRRASAPEPRGARGIVPPSMNAQKIPAIIVCSKCNAFYSPPFALVPGISFTMAGNTMSCPSCGTENAMPDGVFGFVEDVFRRISNVPIEVLQQIAHVASQAQSAGKSPPEIAAEISARVPAFAKFLPKNPGELAAYVAIVVALAGTILQHCKSQDNAAVKQQIIIQQTVQAIERHGRDIDVILQNSSRDAGGRGD